MALGDVVLGIGGPAFGVCLGGVGAWWKGRRNMRAAEVDTTQAKTKSDRELLETVYSVLITRDPTPLEPEPPPGLIERVTNLEKDRTFTGEIQDGHLEGTVHTAVPEVT